MDDEIFRKHYSLQQEALNEIKDIIATADNIGKSAEECLQEIDDIAAYASQVDLLNPIRNEESRALIASLPDYDNEFIQPDILSLARLWFKQR